MNENQKQSSSNVGHVLYDASCGICNRWAPRWEKRLKRLGLGVTPLQSDWVKRRLDLPDEQLLDDVRLLFEDGTVLVGADVYREVLRRIWWAKPLYWTSRTPGLRQALNWAYRKFARHRYRVSSACAWRGDRQ